MPPRFWPGSLEVAAILSSAGSLLLIARQRLDDRLFVESLLQTDLTQLLPFLNTQSLELTGRTGFLWAIPLAIVGVLHSVYGAYMVDDGGEADRTISDQAGEEILWSPMKYIFLFAYLPFALSLVWAKKLAVDLLSGSWGLCDENYTKS